MKKIKAQSIIEFGITFIVAIFMVFFILECAFYYQAHNAVQTFNDEINANLVLYDADIVCSEIQNQEILSMTESKAKKYFKKNIELNYFKNSNSYVEIVSADKINNKPMLTVKISCPPSGLIIKSDYVYNGAFLFKTGSVLSSVSSVETPRF